MAIERIHFWGIAAVPLFYVLAALSVMVFLTGVYLRVSVWLSARGGHKLGISAEGMARVVTDGLLGRRIFRGDILAGLMHSLIMWGFLGLFVGTALSTVDHWFVHYLNGETYRIFSLCMEVFGVMLIAGLVVALVRRYVVRVSRLKTEGPDLWILVLLAVAAITGFFVEGTRLAVRTPDWESFSFGGVVLSHLIASPAWAQAFYPYIWWFHAVICLGLIAYFPFSRLFHSLAAPVSIYRAPQPGVRWARTAAADQEAVADGEAPRGPRFSFGDLIDLSACTRCGRCDEVCPSASAMEPFSPREFIAGANAYTRAAANPLARIKWLRERLPRAFSVAPKISPEQIWYCTTCRACLEICPVCVGAYRSIGQVRAAEIEDGSRVSPLLVKALETLYRFGNPWESSKRKRSEWPAGLAVPDLTEGAHADLCYFVGCTTSFDTRAQKLARAFVRIMTHAGISFGTLGQRETCCGDIARRVGEEGLFEEQMDKTAGLLERYGVTDLVTSSPHCFNLIKNEYPPWSREQEAAALNGGAPGSAAPVRVRHYTQVLAELVDAGLLGRAAAINRRVTYHDPCYLGRYNQIYDAPRRVIRAIPGVTLVEMEHWGPDSLCCGGGGGRMWQELEGEKRLSEVRIKEAAAVGAEILVTGCPYCLIMLEDAAKTADLEGGLKVMDLNELVAESLALGGEEE
jgi:Fe-S oxidoreductase/nitrate reductase gamma subunit